MINAPTLLFTLCLCDGDYHDFTAYDFEAINSLSIQHYLRNMNTTFIIVSINEYYIHHYIHSTTNQMIVTEAIF